jgi:hypothetical protein
VRRDHDPDLLDRRIHSGLRTNTSSWKSGSS